MPCSEHAIVRVHRGSFESDPVIDLGRRAHRSCDFHTANLATRRPGAQDPKAENYMCGRTRATRVRPGGAVPGRLPRGREREMPGGTLVCHGLIVALMTLVRNT